MFNAQLTYQQRNKLAQKDYAIEDFEYLPDYNVGMTITNKIIKRFIEKDFMQDNIYCEIGNLESCIKKRLTEKGLTNIEFDWYYGNNPENAYFEIVCHYKNDIIKSFCDDTFCRVSCSDTLSYAIYDFVYDMAKYGFAQCQDIIRNLTSYDIVYDCIKTNEFRFDKTGKCLTDSYYN